MKIRLFNKERARFLFSHLNMWCFDSYFIRLLDTFHIETICLVLQKYISHIENVLLLCCCCCDYFFYFTLIAAKDTTFVLISKIYDPKLMWSIFNSPLICFVLFLKCLFNSLKFHSNDSTFHITQQHHNQLLLRIYKLLYCWVVDFDMSKLIEKAKIQIFLSF